MMKNLSLVLFMTVLICAGCITTQADLPTDQTESSGNQPPDSPLDPEEQEEISILVELTTSSDWTDLTTLFSDSIQSLELVSITSDNTFHNVDLGGLSLDQSLSAAENGEQLVMAVRYEIEPQGADQILDFELSKGCLGETTIRVYSIQEDELRLLFEREHRETYNSSGCDVLYLQLDLGARLAALDEGSLASEQVLEAEAELFEIQIEFVTTSDWAGFNILNPSRIRSAKMISFSGDPENYHVQQDGMSMNQTLEEAENGKPIGIIARYQIQSEGESQVIGFQMSNGCLNGSSVQFYRIVGNERRPILVTENQVVVTTGNCETLTFQINANAFRTAVESSTYDDLPLVAILSDIQGEVLVKQVGMEDFYIAQEGQQLNVGGEVLTGANAELYLSISDGAVVRLGKNSVFILEMGLSSEEIILPRFKLQLGEMEVVSGSGGFLIYTPGGVAGAIGSAGIVTVSPKGEAEFLCLEGDCFLYDGTPETESVMDRVPDAVAEALEENLGQTTPELIAFYDPDGDGVQMIYDNCPEEGDQGYGVDAQGCPLSNRFGDSDGDGVLNSKDVCPNLADEGFGLDPSGCPLAPLDSDGDGYPDFNDQCPFTYAPEYWSYSHTGCPEGDYNHNGIPDIDECSGETCDVDGDGVYDQFDQCNSSNDLWGWYLSEVDEVGCPIFNDQDWDGDGIPDFIDFCPTVWASTSALSDLTSIGYEIATLMGFSNGCPPGDYDFNGIPDERECTSLVDCLDQDGDGYPDDVDECPEVYAPYVIDNNLGCPPGDNNFNGIPDDAECADCEPPVNQNPLVAQASGDDECSDWDNDGICDLEDQCPLKAGIEVYKGCPDRDTDDDGVWNQQDFCPDLGDQGYGINKFGCPFPEPDPESDSDLYPDSDSDGFHDYVDRCPDVYAPTYWGYDFQGCPVYDYDLNGIPDTLECSGEGCNPDWDGDGIPDGWDLCPTVWAPEDSYGESGEGGNYSASGDWMDPFDPSTYTPGCPHGDYDHNGIPDEKECTDNRDCQDQDGDGYQDSFDQCPEVYAPTDNNQGCPTGDQDFNGIPDHAECEDCELLSYASSNAYECTSDICTQDSDRDGVFDLFDFCPTMGAHVYGLGVDEYGCPIKPTDNSDEGIPDIDECSGETCDADGDGVYDQFDQCNSSGDWFAWFAQFYEVDEVGCPITNDQDWDGDGIKDIMDYCPTVWAALIPTIFGDPSAMALLDPDFNNGCPAGDHDYNGIPDTEECSSSADCLDQDGDGVIDEFDECPEVYAPVGVWDNPLDNSGNVSAQGCPPRDNNFDGIPDDAECAECEPPTHQGIPPGIDAINAVLGSEDDECSDQDNDGICDLEDQCPFKTGTEEYNGCPYPDSDGDGVHDGLDRCPDQGSVGHGVTPFGCPKTAPDQDGDGVVDAVDKCPAQGDMGLGVSASGCPNTTVDQDGDGFADSFDNCPTQGDQGSGVDRRGCPIVVTDSDGDGVIDALDKCPNQGDQGSGVRSNGCPRKIIDDPDGDGVIGALDNCPNQGDQGNGVDRHGCPLDSPDSDGDGVPDENDQCPRQGSEGYGVDRGGCPLPAPDSDGDGVVDSLDKCPLQGDQGYGVDRGGCPLPAPDSDGDGVVDSLDKCPLQGDQGYGVDRGGCPLPAPDSDGDGVPDDKDACPDLGDLGKGITRNGCPVID